MSRTRPRTLLGPWRLMPRIQNTEGVRVPRGRSYTHERDAGRVVVALRWPRIKVPKPVVYVRNVYRQSGLKTGGLRVENMREFDGLWNRLRVHETGKTNVYVSMTEMRKSSYTPWEVLQARGWEMVCEPFLLEEPMHNCTVEMPEAAFKSFYETHRSEERDSVAAYKANDADETPTSRLIAMHYDDLKVKEGWSPERVKRLAAMWSMTIRELCRCILCPPGRVEDYVAGQSIELPGPVMLWFFHMERLAEQQFLGRTHAVPLFPQLNERKAS